MEDDEGDEFDDNFIDNILFNTDETAPDNNGISDNVNGHRHFPSNNQHLMPSSVDASSDQRPTHQQHYPPSDAARTHYHEHHLIPSVASDQRPTQPAHYHHPHQYQLYTQDSQPPPASHHYYNGQPSNNYAPMAGPPQPPSFHAPHHHHLGVHHQPPTVVNDHSIRVRAGNPFIELNKRAVSGPRDKPIVVDTWAVQIGNLSNRPHKHALPQDEGTFVLQKVRPALVSHVREALKVRFRALEICGALGIKVPTQADFCDVFRSSESLQDMASYFIRKQQSQGTAHLSTPWIFIKTIVVPLWAHSTGLMAKIQLDQDFEYQITSKFFEKLADTLCIRNSFRIGSGDGLDDVSKYYPGVDAKNLNLTLTSLHSFIRKVFESALTGFFGLKSRETNIQEWKKLAIALVDGVPPDFYFTSISPKKVDLSRRGETKFLVPVPSLGTLYQEISVNCVSNEKESCLAHLNWKKEVRLMTCQQQHHQQQQVPRHQVLHGTGASLPTSSTSSVKGKAALNYRYGSNCMTTADATYVSATEQSDGLNRGLAISDGVGVDLSVSEQEDASLSSLSGATADDGGAAAAEAEAIRRAIEEVKAARKAEEERVAAAAKKAQEEAAAAAAAAAAEARRRAIEEAARKAEEERVAAAAKKAQEEAAAAEAEARRRAIEEAEAARKAEEERAAAAAKKAQEEEAAAAAEARRRAIEEDEATRKRRQIARMALNPAAAAAGGGGGGGGDAVTSKRPATENANLDTIKSPPQKDKSEKMSDKSETSVNNNGREKGSVSVKKAKKRQASSGLTATKSKAKKAATEKAATDGDGNMPGNLQQNKVMVSWGVSREGVIHPKQMLSFSPAAEARTTKEVKINNKVTQKSCETLVCGDCLTDWRQTLGGGRKGKYNLLECPEEDCPCDGTRVCSFRSSTVADLHKSYKHYKSIGFPLKTRCCGREWNAHYERKEGSEDH